MKNLMEYKGHYAKVEYSAADNVFFGVLEGISDSVSFEGTDTLTLRAAFEEAVEDYLELCAHHGKEPQKPYKGTFNVRVSPDLHRKAVIAAHASGISLNQLVENAISHEVGNL